MIAAVTGPSALWYLSRGAGAVALLALTGALVVGVLHADRRRPAGAPRMLVENAHRWISLLAVAVLAVHVVTSVLDPFAPIGLLDAVVPLHSSYRPVWLGLGALALDLLLALTVTSALRARLGHRAWRAVHWLAYACWPVAVVHGLGTGTDARTAWMLALTLACVAAVVVAVASRLVAAGPGHRGVRRGAQAALAAGALALAVWLPAGPLAPGWAARAGTPPALLGGGARATVPVAAPAPARAHGFSAAVSGIEREGLTADGRAVVDLALHMRGRGGTLRVRLAGQPLDGGGVAMTSSAVTLVHGAAYAGRIARLDGRRLEALVGSADGRALRLRLRLDGAGASVRGRLTVRPVGAGTPG